MTAVDLIPDTAAEWTMVATFLIATVVWAQLRQLRSQARRADRAHVVVSSEGDRDTHALNFVVSNVGRTYATEVAISWDSPIESVSTATSSFDDPALWNPPLMSSGETYRTVLDMSHQRAKTDLPMSYRAEVSWKSPTTDGDHTFRASYVVDFTRFYAQREWRPVDQQPAQLIAALHNIAAAIDRNTAQLENDRIPIAEELGLASASVVSSDEEE